MKKIDMHFHTTLSDGSRTNNELLKEARDKGIDFISATEHDIVNTELTISAHMNGIKAINGVEISSYDEISGKSLHLTCYSDNFSSEINDILENTREKRKLKIRKQIELLKNNGFNIDYEKFIRFYKLKKVNIDNINNFHIEDYIFQNEDKLEKLLLSLIGQKLDKGEFIAKCLKRGGEYNSIGWQEIEKYEPSVEKIGNIARKNNYFLSLAHPNFTFKNDEEGFLNFIDNYQDKFNGIEINSQASEKWVKLIVDTSVKYGMILTFGSDSHHKGRDLKHGDLGDMNKYLTEELIEENFEDFLYELSKTS